MTDQRLEAIQDDDAQDDGGDFAEEHADSTLANQVEGGPEQSEEPESPRGRAGMD